MRPSMRLSLLATLGISQRFAEAYWRMPCSFSQNARVDPIVNPGGVGGHAHKFSGGSNVNQDSTFETLSVAPCSSCSIQKDYSAYWTPQLYYAHSNGTFEDVKSDGMTVYYVGRGQNQSSTVAFPAGFKMISGDMTARSYDNTTLTYLNTRPVADRVSFHCINANNDLPEQHYMFDTDCIYGMRAQLNFQTCWDGVNLYAPDQSHVAYLSGIDVGICPPSHPVPLPGLFYEVLYRTNWIDQTAGGQFVWSNGDTTGYSFHGDFINGWDMDVLNSAVANCLFTDNGGVISACPVLQASVDDNHYYNCPVQPPLNDEPVIGLLKQLPGCNPITSGPASVPQDVCELNSNILVSSNSSNTGTTASTISTVSTAFSNTATSVATTAYGGTGTATSASSSVATTLQTIATSAATTVYGGTGTITSGSSPVATTLQTISSIVTVNPTDVNTGSLTSSTPATSTASPNSLTTVMTATVANVATTTVYEGTVPVSYVTLTDFITQTFTITVDDPTQTSNVASPPTSPPGSYFTFIRGGPRPPVFY